MKHLFSIRSLYIGLCMNRPIGRMLCTVARMRLWLAGKEQQMH